jgi:hypothetical protein
MTARWILIGVGVVFIISGLVLTVLNWAGLIPASYNWQGPIFLVLGIIGVVTAWFSLKSAEIWPLIVLALVYLPWTVIGLIGDIRQRYWPLVIGEAVGLILVVLAILSRILKST